MTGMQNLQVGRDRERYATGSPGPLILKSII